MTTFSEHQWNPMRMLLCAGGDDGQIHAAPLPRVRNSDGVTSTDLRCEACGAPMQLVDVLTVDATPTLATLSYMSDPPLYTTAKLHPLNLIAALNEAGS